MRDLSLISQSVIDPAVRPLVEEAIRAFNGGAHRSATVSAWIAVAVDLTNKVRSLAEAEDSIAMSSVDMLDLAIAAHDVKAFQIFENGLIDLAEKKLEILDRQEAIHLRRLYEDRNLCAHPGFASDTGLFAPTAEAVRAHLVSAHDAVFSKHAVAGKRRQKLLIEELQGESWPRISRLSDYLDSRFFEGASTATMSNMMKLLIKSAIVPPTDSERPKTVARRAREASLARRERDPKGFANAVTAVLSSWENSGKLTDAALVRAVGAYGRTSDLWDALPDTAIERATSYIRQADNDVLIEGRFFVSGSPLHDEISSIFDETLEELNQDDLAKVLRQARELVHFVPRILELIGESKDFETAATRMQLLARVSIHFTAADVVLLEQKIVNNSGDQIRPARDVEEALIAAFEAAQPSEPSVLAAWQSLASTLVGTTDAKRYFGNYQEVPYGRFHESMKS